jgi:hypothetical protein
LLTALCSWRINFIKIRVPCAVENHFITFVYIPICTILAVVVREVNGYTVFCFNKFLCAKPSLCTTQFQRKVVVSCSSRQHAQCSGTTLLCFEVNAAATALPNDSLVGNFCKLAWL